MHVTPEGPAPSDAGGHVMRGDRLALGIFAACGAVQTGLAAAGLPGWPCPLAKACGIPCPGCGLTRATVVLLSGDWRHAFALHAFAPLVVLAGAALLVSAALPSDTRARAAANLHALERRWHTGKLLAAALLLYWLSRFVLDGPVFLQLAR